MFSKKCIYALITGAGCLVTCFMQSVEANTPPTQAQSALTSEEVALDFERDLQKLEAFYSVPEPERKLADFESVAQSLIAKWQQDQQRRDYLALKVCQALSSLAFDGQLRRDLLHQYGLKALSLSPPVGVAAQAQIVMCIMSQDRQEMGKASLSQLPTLRSEIAQRWLFTAQRLEQSIDENYDPNSRRNATFLNLSPSAPTGYISESKQLIFSGMRPEDIQDPVVRAAYSEALRANAEKAKKNREQNQLRRIQQSYQSMLEPRLVEAYSKAPYNVRELKQLLAAASINKDTQKRILDAVAQRMRLTVEGAKADPATPQSVEKK